MTTNNSLKNNSSIGRSRYVGGSVEVAVAAAVGHYIVGSSRPKSSSSSVLTSDRPHARNQANEQMKVQKGVLGICFCCFMTE